jgi:transcription initiation factor TFIIIB Brf1 subunit/transcription initiation factor TFIIB
MYDYELGEMACSKCGTVIGEQRNNDFFTTESFIDIYHTISDMNLVEDRSSYMMGHESKVYGTRGSGLSGVGGNIITSYVETMDFSSTGIMSSKMDSKNVDYMGKKVEDPKYINRLRYINNITSCNSDKNPNEKNTKQAVLLIKQISQKKNFPLYIQESAVKLYRKVSEKNQIKRLQYKITAYWCLYYTLREHDLTPSLPEYLGWLVDLGLIDEKSKTAIQKKINKVQIFIMELLDISPIPHSDYIKNIIFLCNKHGLDEIIKRQCIELGKVINDNGGSMVYQGRSPKTIATMLISVIMVNENKRTQCSELLKELKITTMILRKILAEIIDAIKKNAKDLENMDDLIRVLLLL